MSDPKPASAPDKSLILLVDDHPEYFRQIAAILSDDYRVHLAASGAEALEWARRERPQLIVTDVRMPDIDGIALLKALRADPGTAPIPVILLSGACGDDTRVEGFETGADHYLTKPFTLRELRARIRSSLQAARIRQTVARAEATLQAQELIARERAEILESITDAFYALDRQWRFTYVNQRALDYFGRRREELLNRSVWDAFPKTRGTPFGVNFERAVSEQRSMVFEALSPVTGRWVEVHAYPTPRGLAVTFQDITRRKHVEAELKLHSRVLGSMSEGVCVTDDTGCIVYTNPAENRMFGYDAGELIGQRVTVLNAYPPQENERRVREVIELLQRGEVWSGEWHNRCKDGRTFYTHAFISGLEREGRRFRVCVQRDITEQKAHAEQLRESEARFRTMADSAPVFIWISDEQNRCTFFNRPWLAFTGRRLEQETGAGWMEGVHPEDLPRCLDIDQVAFTTRTPLTMEYRLRRHDGEYRWMLDRGIPLHDGPNGAFTGFVGSCIDITEIKEAELKLQSALAGERHAREEAERLGRLKDEFLATLSHELRTPLNAMLGWTVLLRQNHTPDLELGQGLAAIERNARSQARIISDLLDMSGLLAGKVRLEMQPVSLYDVLEAAMASIVPAAQARGVQLEKMLAARSARVLGDADRLQQVFWNLLSNAVKFTPGGGHIRVGLREAPAHLEVSIEDTGEGIPPEFMPYVFDRFRQADSSIRRRTGGLGLGLSIVRSLVELHGGTVRASSPGLGRGTTFTVDLPLALAPTGTMEPDARVAATEHTGGIPLPSLESMRILVVDDESDARELIARILTDRGAGVIAVGSADEALQLLEQRPIDVLVSDLAMPGVDGYDFIRVVRARKQTANIPAIALTAYARADDRQRALLTGYQQHLAKPVEPAELVASVASLGALSPRQF